MGDMLAVLRRDFARNPDVMTRATLVVFRLGQHARGPLRLLWRVLDTLYLRLLLGTELPPDTICGSGLKLPHAGRGVTLNPGVVIGEDAWIYHRVTIGQRGPGRPPILGDRVYIGAGACILGPVTVGDDARVGANAVVIRDVPADTIAVGVPAH